MVGLVLIWVVGRARNICLWNKTLGDAGNKDLVYVTGV